MHRTFLLVLLLALFPNPAQAGWQFWRCNFEDLAASSNFLAQRQDLPFLQKNWALDASGADLMRNHPALRNGDYENNQVAVIDTGLYVNGNPDAGRALGRRSPEMEYDQHGTGVVGVVASQRYGVNPRLRVVAVPVEYRQENIVNFFAGRIGFDPRALREKWKAVIDDPKISVINLSMSDIADPEIQGYVREALAKGKWVIAAAGNSGAINDPSSAAAGEFSGQPGFFLSGALSYLGAPATFSHRGPGVKFYSPGTSVETLSSGYNPNLVTTQTGTHFDGTSFSAPHLSAVLASLRAIDPKLTPQDANFILEATAIKRGKEGDYLQVNPLHAVELLSRARKLERAGKCSGAACYAAARDSIALEVSVSVPRPPRFGTRAGWLKYYNELRRNYFLSNGDPAHAKPLREFLLAIGRKEGAESVYFSAAMDGDPLHALDPQGADMREQYARAKEVLTEPSSTPVSDTTLLENIPSVPANVDIFLERGSEFFYTGVDRVGMNRALGQAKKPFLLALARKLVEKGKPLAAPEIILHLSTAAESPAEKALAAEVAELAVQGWKQNGNVEYLAGFVVRMNLFTPTQRAKLLADFLELRKANGLKAKFTLNYNPLSPANLDFLEGQLRVWQKELGPHEAMVRKSFAPTRGVTEAHTAAGDWAFTSARVEAGHATEADLAASLGRLLNAIRKNNGQHAGDPYLGDMVLRPFATATASEKSARAMADRLLKENNFKTLGELIGHDQVFVGLLHAVKDGPTRAKLLEVYVPLMKGRGRNGAEQLAKQLYALKSIPEVQDYINKLLEKKQDDPELQRMRIVFLKNAAYSTKELNDYGRTYLRETFANGRLKLEDLPFGQVVNDKELVKFLIGHFEHPDAAVIDPAVLINWAMSASGKDFAKIAPVIAVNLIENAIESRNMTAELMHRLGNYMAVTTGRDLMLQHVMMRHVGVLLWEPTYGRRPEEEGGRRGYGTPREAGLIVAALELARGKEGAKALEQNPKMLQLIADKIMANPRVQYFSRAERVFPPLGEIFAKKLPTADELVAAGDFSGWASAYLMHEPKELDRVLKYLEHPRIASAGYALETLLNAVSQQVHENPRLVPKLRDFGRAHPTSQVSLLLEELGYTP